MPNPMNFQTDNQGKEANSFLIIPLDKRFFSKNTEQTRPGEAQRIA
jgi:hypothetical protein